MPSRRAAFLCVALTAAATFAGLAQAPARRVLFDEAHHNLFAGAATGYQPFVQLMRDEGASVTIGRDRFSASALEAVDVLVVVNPNAAANDAPREQRESPAFTPAEVDAVDRWVRAGGSLLLVSDHYPTGVSARALAERFGAQLSGGWTDDPDRRRTIGSYGPVFGQLRFTRATGSIGDHPITSGRDQAERVDIVDATAGESIAGPPGATTLLRLGERARDFVRPSDAPARPPSPASLADVFNSCPACATVSASGRGQGVAFDVERGRVVMLSEMGMLVDYDGGTGNRQFAINVVRWLARRL